MEGPIEADALDIRALQRLVDAFPLPALLADVQPEGRVLGMNREFMHLLECDVAGLTCLDGLWNRAVSSGVTAGGVSNGTLSARAGVERARAWWRSLRPAGAQRAEPFELHVLRSDGTPCSLRVSVGLLGARALLVFTELRPPERALRESEEKLRLVIAATRLGLWQWDIQGDVVEWDDTMLEIWGLTRAELPQARSAYVRSLHPDDADRITQAIQVALATGSYPPMEHRVVRPDGSIRHVAAHAVITRAADGSPAKFIGSARDVTEERELVARRQTAERLESIGQLSAGVAHNFNNLLMGIIPNLDLALSSAPPEMTTLLDAARTAAVRAADLVMQLTTFAGRAQAAPRRINEARQLVERAVAMCRPTLERPIELGVRCAEHSPFVSVDAARLEQALFNVLSNARDAVSDPVIGEPVLSVTLDTVESGDPAVAQLGLRGARTYVRIGIRDNGVGMSAEVARRIFEPFFSTKAPGRGTGLGLSTALAIVREHEGAIDCVSAPGSGSTFSIFLPEVLAEADALRAATGRAPAAAREVILIVDDEAPVREVVRRILTREGYVTHVASGATEALEALGDLELRRSLSLVILDMSMPGMSGRQALGKLRELLPDIPIVFLSGYALETPDEADGFIRKPVSASVLAEAVRELLARRWQRAPSN